jgi:hypothetical protein
MFIPSGVVDPIDLIGNALYCSMVLLQFTTQNFDIFPQELLNLILSKYLEEESFPDTREICLNGEGVAQISFNSFFSSASQNKNEQYFGKILGSKPHGQGLMYFENEGFFDGIWRYGKKVKGRLYTPNESYEGGFENDMFNGHGVITTPESRFEGEFEKGEFCGYGSMRHFDGELHEGQYRDNCKNGVGITYKRNGDKYEGEYINDRLSGPVKITYQDSGDQYEGEIRSVVVGGGNGVVAQKHGKGTLRFESGDVYEGKFVAGKRADKQGVMRYVNGDRYEGEWKEDVRSGQGTMYYASGNRYVGSWANDQKHGKGTTHYASGNKYEAEWVNGECAKTGKFISK